MFTGLITDIGIIMATQTQGCLRATIACHYPAESLQLGESIAHNGCCLTVVNMMNHPSGLTHYDVELSQETLNCTATHWKTGEKINLERSMALGERMGGHLVTGHIDGVASLISITPLQGSHELCIEIPAELAPFIAAKGSVTLDGVALTVNRVQGCQFWVCIIPHSWAHTTLGERKAGDGLNLEIDLIARYVARLLEAKG